MSDILLLNGPNLNLLGNREREYYGAETLDEVVGKLDEIARTANLILVHHQENSEARLIRHIHESSARYIIINPAALTHTSIALRDALAAVKTPFIEVHLSNIHGREDFRRRSYFSEIAVGVISGLGAAGYEYALRFAISYLKKNGH